MKRFLLMVLAFLVVGNVAWATSFDESYLGGAYLQEEGCLPSSYSYYFDIAKKNDKKVDGGLYLVEDAALSQGLESAELYLELCTFDVFQKEEYIKVSDGSLANTFKATIGEDQCHASLSFTLSGDFLKNANGEFYITAIDGSDFNNFCIKKIGIRGETGAAPVPEPAMILLLGSGLVGIAGFGRKKIIQRKS